MLRATLITVGTWKERVYFSVLKAKKVNSERAQYKRGKHEQQKKQPPSPQKKKKKNILTTMLTVLMMLMLVEK